MPVSMLASWNGEMSEHLPEPLIYSTWMKFLQKNLIDDDLGQSLSDLVALILFLSKRFFVI